MSKKVILVTGSSRGIGRYLIESFAARGHKVIVNYSTSKDEAEAVTYAYVIPAKAGIQSSTGTGCRFSPA